MTETSRFGSVETLSSFRTKEPETCTSVTPPLPKVPGRSGQSAVFSTTGPAPSAETNQGWSSDSGSSDRNASLTSDFLSERWKRVQSGLIQDLIQDLDFGSNVSRHQEEEVFIGRRREYVRVRE